MFSPVLAVLAWAGYKIADKWFDPLAARLADKLPALDESTAKTQREGVVPQDAMAGNPVPQDTKPAPTAPPRPEEADAATDPALGARLEKQRQEQEQRKQRLLTLDRGE